MVTDTPYLRKPADAHHPIHSLISERWSPRAFSDQAVEPEKLHSLFEAARWAASAANKQPWYFIYATKERSEEHARFVSIMNEGNVRWAQHAPLLILTVAKRAEYAGKEFWPFYDVGMAAANLVIQAVELGLVTHQMGGYSVEKARELLAIPEGYDPLALIAVGYPGDHTLLPDEFHEREQMPRTRKPQNEFVFEGKWSEQQ